MHHVHQLRARRTGQLIIVIVDISNGRSGVYQQHSREEMVTIASTRKEEKGHMTGR
jgi:hypothetical protein